MMNEEAISRFLLMSIPAERVFLHIRTGLYRNEISSGNRRSRWSKSEEIEKREVLKARDSKTRKSKTRESKDDDQKGKRDVPKSLCESSRIAIVVVLVSADLR